MCDCLAGEKTASLGKKKKKKVESEKIGYVVTTHQRRLYKDDDVITSLCLPRPHYRCKTKPTGNEEKRTKIVFSQNSCRQMTTAI